jgi:hypothetical protein
MVLLAFALVWVPEVRLYWVGLPTIDEIDVETARRVPERAVLEEIGTQLLAARPMERVVAVPTDSLRRTAERVLAGEVSFSARTSQHAFPFEASNLDSGPPENFLPVASMGTVYVLLNAYRATGERTFLESAVTEALAFASVDQWRLVPRGLLWNDHALATRLAVLALLWSEVREDAAFDLPRARRLLALAERTAARLRKHDLFTYRTNHGVMQSLALLQYSIAFPSLSGAADSRRIGCQRLSQQMEYYIHPEGATLEHSSGYHELGRELLELSLKLFARGGCVAPDDWEAKLVRAKEFSRLLMRPDRTVPVTGDTDHVPRPLMHSLDLTQPPPRDFTVLLGAEVAVSWGGLNAWPDGAALRQTVVTWSNYPSQAHKHADDMSVVVWAVGRPWLTNTGYWPYGVRGRKEAMGWGGSNAPHVHGEPAQSTRATTVLAKAHAAGVKFLDLERRLENGIALRRQILELAGPTWIVIDSAQGAADGMITRRLWTTMPETKVERLNAHDYLLRATDRPSVARVTFGGDVWQTPTVKQGERSPYAGWIVRNEAPVAAPTFELEQTGTSLVATILSLENTSDAAPQLEGTGQRPESWRVALEVAGKKVSVAREGDRLAVPGAQVGGIAIEAIPSDAAAKQTVLAAYESATRTYPGMRDLLDARYRAVLWLLILLIAQELALVGTRRWLPRVVPALRLAAATAWLAVGLAAYFWYLR